MVLLQIKRGYLDCLLLIGGQPCQAVGEGVGNAKLQIFLLMLLYELALHQLLREPLIEDEAFLST
jgi:hypothetical protein